MLWSVGSLLIVKADTEATDGAFAMVDLRSEPGYETPLHTHHREDEQFCLLDGEIESHYADGETLVAVAAYDLEILGPSPE